MNRALLAATRPSSANSKHGTPPALFKRLHRIMRFTLDACAEPHTAKLKRFVQHDGLNVPWVGERVFDNPPYGREIAAWALKARDEALFAAAPSASLYPHRPDARWWGDGVLCEDGTAGRVIRAVYDEAARVLWLVRAQLVTGIWNLDERQKFEGQQWQAPFPSAVVFHAPRGWLPPGRSDPLCKRWPT